MLSKLLNDKKSKNLIMYGLIGIIALILVIVLFSSMNSGTKVSSYSDVENKLINAAKKYFSKNRNLLPTTIGESVTVDSATLESGKYIKKLSKMVKGNASCNGKVIVYNTNGNYNYESYLDCGSDYKTVKLNDYILENEVVTTTGEGLYKVNNSYIYRGEKVNNYITFAGREYRIVRIYDDGSMDIIASTKTKSSIKSVWDDRYNSDKNSNYGINNYSVSRIKENLLSYLNSNSFTDNDRTKLVPFSLCVSKVSSDQAISLDGECSATIDNQLIGLLNVSTLDYVSIDSECRNIGDGSCQNYNYLLGGDPYSWWTLSTDYNNSHKAYYAYDYVTTSNCSSSKYIREVLRISDGVVYVRGNGTQTNPYVIK